MVTLGLMSAGPGFLGRMVRRLTSDVSDLDADDLSAEVARAGCDRCCDGATGEAITVRGRLRSVEICPRESVATLEAELFDGTDGVTLVWMGRRRIPGIEPGRTLRASGRVAIRGGRKVIYNPYYELQRAP